MEIVSILAGSGWASGINLYLVAVLLGVTGRLGWADIPEVLMRWDVIVVAFVLFLIEFVADKIPYLDNLWDGVHTFVRPLGAAALGAVLVGQSPSIGALVAAVVAGGLAINAHAAKATTRLAVNASPEPVSNISLSVFEDFGVAGLIVLAVTYPLVTVIVVGILVVGAGALVYFLWRVARKTWRRVGDRFGRTAPAG